MSISQLRASVLSAFRDYVTDGVPASGRHEPVKSEIRTALGDILESVLSSIGEGISRFATLTEMEASTDPAGGQLAYVYFNNSAAGDAANGIYQFDAVSGNWIAADWYFAATTAAVQGAVDELIATSALLVSEIVTAVDTPNGFHPLSTGDTAFVDSTSAVIYTAGADVQITEVGTWIWALGSGAASLTVASGTLPNLTFVSEIALPAATSTGAAVWTPDDFGTINLTAGQHLLINSPAGGIQQSTIAATGMTAYFTYPALLTSGSATLSSAANTRFTAYASIPVDNVVVQYENLSQEVKDLITDQAGEAPTMFDMFLIAGQSNAQGYNTNSGTPAIPAGHAFQYYSGDLDPLTGDPVGNSTGSSAWPAFANSYYERTGRGVIFVPTAAGGSSLLAASDTGGFGNWSSTGALRGAAITALTAAKLAADANGLAWQFAGVLWSQGENDAVAIDAALVTKAQYKAEFDVLLAYFEAQTGSPNMPFLISRTGRNSGGDTIGYQQIRAAQTEAVQANANVFMAFTGALNFPARSLMEDDVHYKVAGYDEMGASMATVAAYRCLGAA